MRHHMLVQFQRVVASELATFRGQAAIPRLKPKIFDIAQCAGRRLAGCRSNHRVLHTYVCMRDRLHKHAACVRQWRTVFLMC